MRRKHNLFYLIDRHDDKCWWQNGKWHRIEDVDESKSFSNGPIFHQKKFAIGCLLACPPGSIMTQFYYIHGRRYCTEYEA